MSALKPLLNLKNASLQEWKTTLEGLRAHLTAPLIILLEGPMGAGKTQTIQLLKNILNLKGDVSSPTFAVFQTYRGTNFPFTHVDLYRTESEDELESTGFWDIFQENQIVAIEWPSRINADHLPLGWKQLHITIEKTQSENLRNYNVKTNE